MTPTNLRMNTALQTQQRRERRRLLGLITPGLLWLLLFFLLPLLIIVVYSFLERSPTGEIAWRWGLHNYRRLLGDPIYFVIFARSFGIALATTVLTLLIGYPMALFIARQSERRRTVLIFLVMLPFWTNFLVRMYAWQFLLNNTGLINSTLESLGLAPLGLINTTSAVLVGLVYGELPYMVLPLYAILERFPWALLEAAEDLGASRARAFWRVLLPLTLPGVTAGAVLVFIPTIGSFVVPQLLGGGKVAMLGNVLERQFLAAQDQPFGSTIALVFMLLLLAAIVVYFRATTPETR